MNDQAKQDAPDLPQHAGTEPNMPDIASSPPLESAGTRLARRRLELGWTVEHVAGRLNLAPRQIDALESDNLAALPGMASTRGFVRAYAKLLRMDAAPLIAALAQESSPQEEAIPLRRPIPTAPFAPAKLAPMKRGGSNNWLWVLLGLVLVAVAAGGAWQAGLLNLHAELPAALAPGSAPGADSSPAANENPTPADSAASAGDAAASSGGAAAAADPTAGASGTSATEAGAQQTTPAQSVAPSSAAPAAPAGAAATTAPVVAKPSALATSTPVSVVPATAATTAAVAAPPAKPGAAARGLVIKVNEECWIEIKRGEDAVLTRTLHPGDTEVVDVAGGVAVTLGNVHGVDLTLAGKALDVRSKARNNVVRLDLK